MKSAILVVGLAASAAVYGAKGEPDVVVVVVPGEISPPPAVEQSGRAEASWILARAGVRVAWQSTPPPAAAGRVTVELRYGKAASGVSDGALAFARPFGDGGVLITVLYDRVQFAGGKSSRAASVLAHVLAHELGHVLQRSNAHAPEGLMKARWRGDDYAEMEQKRLRFTATDVELMREGLAHLKSSASVPTGALAAR
jgi:hypothetical protein